MQAILMVRRDKGISARLSTFQPRPISRTRSVGKWIMPELKLTPSVFLHRQRHSTVQARRLGSTISRERPSTTPCQAAAAQTTGEFTLTTDMLLDYWRCSGSTRMHLPPGVLLQAISGNPIVMFHSALLLIIAPRHCWGRACKGLLWGYRIYSCSIQKDEIIFERCWSKTIYFTCHPLPAWAIRHFVKKESRTESISSSHSIFMERYSVAIQYFKAYSMKKNYRLTSLYAIWWWLLPVEEV